MDPSSNQKAVDDPKQQRVSQHHMKRALNPYRVGKWLPSDSEHLNNYVTSFHLRVEDNPDRALTPVIEKFKNWVEEDAEAHMYFTLMFQQVPHEVQFKHDPSGKHQIRLWGRFIQVLNEIVQSAPEFNRTGLVGCPLNALLDWSMGTTAGYAAFLNPRINAQLKIVLNSWGEFLLSPESCSVLNTDTHKGWFGLDAQLAMPNFIETFICEPTKPHFGFKSWDDFFTRRFREEARPIASPDDDNVVVNACESAPYRLAGEAKRNEKFWIKAQPYSLKHILNEEPEVDHFVGGTIYQAYLSPTSYHRWHAPVSGTIEKIRIVEGTYYAEALSEGFDEAGPNDSQGYIAEVAARALIFIKAKNPSIGLMCFVAIGMAEVSSCDVTVKEKEEITKGQQIGMFHFGGSSHLLIFHKDVPIWWELGQQPGLNANNINVRSKIATILPATKNEDSKKRHNTKSDDGKGKKHQKT